MVLPDGRTLAYDDVGAPDGEALIWFHGAPDCRLARHPDDGVVASMGIRLLALDRPGYGRSDPAPEPSFAATAGDVGPLLDALGLERCRLAAWSAGSPRALAAAAALGDRVTRVSCYAAIPPIEAGHDPAVRDATAARHSVSDAVLKEGIAPAKIAGQVVRWLLPVEPVPPDMALELVAESLGGRSRTEIDSVPGALEMLAASLAEATAVHGKSGLVDDLVAQLTVGQAGVVTAAACPVHLIHGDRDPISGPAVGRWYAEHLPSATIEVWEEGSHHALFPRWRDLLR